MSERCPHCQQIMPDANGIVVDEDRSEIRINGFSINALAKHLGRGESEAA